MGRRTFIGALAGALLAASLAAQAQQVGHVSRIGVVNLVPPEASLGFQALREGLRDFGYTEGKNIVFEYRWPEGMPRQLDGKGRPG
jgi:putative ABC transport system substrate-binding protein